MKKANTQSQTSEHALSEYIGAEAADSPAMITADNNPDLAELVWKHFAEEISAALSEVQNDLGLETGGRAHQVSHRK
jgi:hypothetical protein